MVGSKATRSPAAREAFISTLAARNKLPIPPPQAAAYPKAIVSSHPDLVRASQVEKSIQFNRVETHVQHEALNIFHTL